MKSLKKGPSPGLIIAVAAMTFALVGTAVAATGGEIYPKITKSKVKKIAKKQATKQLKANVNNSHVNLADEATTADTATNAENLGGSPPSDYQKVGLAPFTAITAFNNNWSRFFEHVLGARATGSTGTASSTSRAAFTTGPALRRSRSRRRSDRRPTGAT